MTPDKGDPSYVRYLDAAIQKMMGTQAAPDEYMQKMNAIATQQLAKLAASGSPAELNLLTEAQRFLEGQKEKAKFEQTTGWLNNQLPVFVPPEVTEQLGMLEKYTFGQFNFVKDTKVAETVSTQVSKRRRFL